MLHRKGQNENWTDLSLLGQGPTFMLIRFKCVNVFLTGGFVRPYHLKESISSFMGFWWMLSLPLHFAKKFL